MLEFNPASPNASGNLARRLTCRWRSRTTRGPRWRASTPTSGATSTAWCRANYDIAPPIPLGLVLSMLTVVPNDPGPILDTRPGSPHHRTSGSPIPGSTRPTARKSIRENWEFYPGRTTFIDTIVIPVGAFVRQPRSAQLRLHRPDPGTPAGRTRCIVSTGDRWSPSPRSARSSSQPELRPHGRPRPQLEPAGRLGSLLRSADGGLEAVHRRCRGHQPDLGRGRAAPSASPSPAGARSAGGQVVVRGATTGAPPRWASPCTRRGASSHRRRVRRHRAARAWRAAQSSRPSTALPGHDHPARSGDLPGEREPLEAGHPAGLRRRCHHSRRDRGPRATSPLESSKRSTSSRPSRRTGRSPSVPGQASNFTLEQGAGILVAGCGNTPVCGALARNEHQLLQGRRGAQIDGLTITGADRGRWRHPGERLRRRSEDHQQRDHLPTRGASAAASGSVSRWWPPSFNPEPGH